MACEPPTNSVHRRPPDVLSVRTVSFVISRIKTDEGGEVASRTKPRTACDMLPEHWLLLPSNIGGTTLGQDSAVGRSFAASCN